MICRTCGVDPVMLIRNLLDIALHSAVHIPDRMCENDVRLFIPVDIVVNRYVARDFIDIPSEDHFLWRFNNTLVMCPVCKCGSWQGQREY